MADWTTVAPRLSALQNGPSIRSETYDAWTMEVGAEREGIAMNVVSWNENEVWIRADAQWRLGARMAGVVVQHVSLGKLLNSVTAL